MSQLFFGDSNYFSFFRFFLEPREVCSQIIRKRVNAWLQTYFIINLSFLSSWFYYNGFWLSSWSNCISASYWCFTVLYYHKAWFIVCSELSLSIYGKADHHSLALIKRILRCIKGAFLWSSDFFCRWFVYHGLLWFWLGRLPCYAAKYHRLLCFLG